MARQAVWSTCLVCVVAPWPGHEGHNNKDEITDIAERLNGEIAGSGGAYTAGKGVIVRTPDFFTGNTKVVPASFWSNDIFAPSQLYPATIDPMCPMTTDGWSELTKDCSAGSPWETATVAVVISSEIANILTDWDSIQDADWGWGVFYPFDSNSADKRCAWRDEWDGWDCPGGFMEADGVTYYEDATKGGAGQYLPGNPYTGGEGGGAGCHIDSGAFDQMDAEDEMNLVQDMQCQCNYAFNNDWHYWVDTWMSKAHQKTGLEWRGWFADGKAPTWGVDASICWVNNFRDLISLQNELYFHSQEWSNQLAPESNWGGGVSSEDRIYWGWNEIPVETSRVEDPLNWDSIIIKLPADICRNGGGDDNFHCMGGDQMRDLNEQLKSFEEAGHLLKGLKHVAKRPGSYILFVREYRVDNGWNRYFFCRHTVILDREIHTKDKACYYDEADSPAPAPEAPKKGPPECDCEDERWHKPHACKEDDGTTCFPVCCGHGLHGAEMTV